MAYIPLNRIIMALQQLLTIFLIVALSITQAEARKVRNILVLHSYHQGLQWTDNITEGIKSEFSDIQNEIEIHYEYLDTKRNPGERYFRRMVRFEGYKTILSDINFEVIICSDNNALRFLVDFGDQFYALVPVVFCGVNNYSKHMLKGRTNITGVVENTDFKSTLEIIQKLHPDRNRILVVLDKTPTGNAIKKEFDLVSKRFSKHFTFEYYRDFILDEVSDKISGLGKNDLIYLLTFNRDRIGNFISYIEGIRIVRSKSGVPIYGSWDFYFGNGIVGGMITSGFTQGQQAARLAKKILNGKSADSIPVITKSPNRYMFDYREMKRFGIKKSQLPLNTDFINLPPGIFEEFRKMIISVLSIFTPIILILIWRLAVHYRRESMLKKINQELDRRVEEQTFELMKKNKLLKTEILERKQLEKEIRKLAFTDPLTGINNRRSFMIKAETELIRSRRYEHFLSVLMMDIDHFKKINDTYGHHIGDLALKEFSNICSTILRENDIFGRLGGEEFAIILVETDTKNAIHAAERLRHEISSTIIKENNISFSIRVSIGVAVFRDSDQTIEDIICRADKGLYKAKNLGRNRVIVV